MSQKKITKPRTSRKTRLPFERVALLLQGGGALGSYQAGVYEALAEYDICPDWIAGISIGAVNAALIAGNPPGKCITRLREFWELVTRPPLGPLGIPYISSIKINDHKTHSLLNQTRALGTLLFGAPDFFMPRLVSPFLLGPQTPDKLSYYDANTLKSTLEKLIDFDLLNEGGVRFGVGAVNVRTGNFTYFDNACQKICPEHIMASGALPPGLPAVEIDGEYYWDGGMVSNTPLEWVFSQRPHQDTLAFQVDLWSAIGNLPKDMADVENRQKDIRFSSRTRAATDNFKMTQTYRHAFRGLLNKLPKSLRDDPDVKLLEAESDESVYNVVQLIYHAQSYEGISKDFEFSQRSMEEHWKAGYDSAKKALSEPRILQRPHNLEGFQAFDFSHR